MRTHTLLGEQMLGGVAFLQGAGLEVVRNHHERWDGDGYPDRLEREQIPLGARIFAVADSLDAMTTDRPYRKRRTVGGRATRSSARRASSSTRPWSPRSRRCEPELREIAREFAVRGAAGVGRAPALDRSAPEPRVSPRGPR